MKLALVLLLVTSSFAALGWPGVGDKVVYRGKSEGKPIESRIELLSFDPVVKMFRQSYTWGSKNIIISMKKEQLASEESVKRILDNCETSQKGKLETVTVAAGTFVTCLIVDHQGTKNNIGNVPFGLVKAVSKTFSLELHESHVGQ